jgi:serine/threonine protein phosphatase 1
MTWVIGDIHGCLDQLKELFKNIKPLDKVIFLGDYIDRGPDSKGVLDFLMNVQETFEGEAIFLKGNHEDMCLHWLGAYAPGDNNFDLGQAFVYNGAHATLKSFGWDRNTTHFTEFNIPQKYVDWMLSLRTSYEDENGIYVHAGLRPFINLADQLDEDLMWIRDEFIYSDCDFGKTVYFGHTPCQKVMLSTGNKVGVDTGCVYGHRLSMISVPEHKTISVPGWVKE